jgi:pimeloyl-ACP methyl ester carboxylesterase
MPTQATPVAAAEAVRTRRAYFDFRHGQLHVRTAFPTTGGFDEEATLFCLHGLPGSSRMFSRFLPLIATDRSVYAPDLPGSGESDPAPDGSARSLAAAIVDLARDLRIRQIDLLAFEAGRPIATELALTEPALVRRLILVGTGERPRLSDLAQPSLVMTIGHGHGLGELDSDGRGEGDGNIVFVHAPDCAEDLFDAAPHTLVTRFAAFLNAPS